MKYLGIIWLIAFFYVILMIVVSYTKRDKWYSDGICNTCKSEIHSVVSIKNGQYYVCPKCGMNDMKHNE